MECLRVQYWVSSCSLSSHSLALLLASHGVDGHFYADGCQIYLHFCLNIKTWMREQKLKLNESKTEIILIKSNLRVSVTHEFGKLDVEASTLAPVNTVQNFGISFDSEPSFKKQIDTVVKNCNFQFHNIYEIRKFLD